MKCWSSPGSSSAVNYVFQQIISLGAIMGNMEGNTWTPSLKCCFANMADGCTGGILMLVLLQWYCTCLTPLFPHCVRHRDSVEKYAWTHWGWWCSRVTPIGFMFISLWRTSTFLIARLVWKSNTEDKGPVRGVTCFQIKTHKAEEKENRSRTAEVGAGWMGAQAVHQYGTKAGEEAVDRTQGDDGVQ